MSSVSVTPSVSYPLHAEFPPDFQDSLFPPVFPLPASVTDAQTFSAPRPGAPLRRSCVRTAFFQASVAVTLPEPAAAFAAAAVAWNAPIYHALSPTSHAACVLKFQPRPPVLDFSLKLMRVFLPLFSRIENNAFHDLSVSHIFEVTFLILNTPAFFSSSLRLTGPYLLRSRNTN